MYLDQGLKEHTLLKAIARVNRPYKDKKTHGLIVDYWGISKNLRDAFELYDDSDIQNSLRPLDDQKELLKEQYRKVMAYFENLSDKNELDEAIAILKPEDIREQFEYDFKQFSKTMDAVLPDPVTNQYLQNLLFLAKVRAAARTAYFDESLNLEGYGEKVKKLIEESIKASETIMLIPPTKIDNKNFMKLVNSYGSNQTRASIIESKIRKVVEENEEKNPEFYKTLRDRLERLIAIQREKKFADARDFMKLQILLNELFAEEERSKALGFNVRVQFAIFGILEKATKDFESAKNLTFHIYHALQTKVIDWRQKENILKKMRVAIKDILSGNNISKDVIVVNEIVVITNKK